MTTRSPRTCLILLALVPFGIAKDKKDKQVLPNYVLQAQTLAVVILPDAGEPITDPTANRTAEENVEKALQQWGRYRVVAEITYAYLVICVRKGHAGGPTIRNSPADNRPVIFQQPGPETTRIGVQQGTPPPATFPGTQPSPVGPTGPTIANEGGNPEDTFELFLGGVDYPLDAAPVWRYMAANALNAPTVRAVEEFRKAYEDSEKQQKQQKP
jgi:hypothetical protein